MKLKDSDNYSVNWGFAFLPYGSKISVNFKEKQLDRDKVKEFVNNFFENIIPKEIYLFKELKDKKGRDNQKLFLDYDNKFSK